MKVTCEEALHTIALMAATLHATRTSEVHYGMDGAMDADLKHAVTIYEKTRAHVESADAAGKWGSILDDLEPRYARARDRASQDEHPPNPRNREPRRQRFGDGGQWSGEVD